MEATAIASPLTEAERPRLGRRPGWAVRWLPRGGSLPEALWRRRHRIITAILGAHVPAIPLFAVARGYPLVHGLEDAAPVVAFTVLACLSTRGRKFLSVSAAFGLLTASAILVHLSGGTIEMHFHFFVVIGILTMYEDWLPFLVAIAFVLVHHGLMGQLAPRFVYNHPAAWAHPWRWAAIHGLFVFAASAVFLVAWRMNEDIRAQLAESLERLGRTDEDRRRLLGRVVHTREDEGRRIAAELHDGPVQRLTSLDYIAERASLRLESGNTDGMPDLFEQIQGGLREEIAALRRMMTELRPPVLDERGLEAALRDHVDSVGRRSGLQCAIRWEIDGRLQPAVEGALYRVVQEALTNVVRHADATAAAVSLERQDGHVLLRVTDDGKGFDPERALFVEGEEHFGLIAMRERVLMEGGECEVRSVPDRGTELRVSFPAEVVLS